VVGHRGDHPIEERTPDRLRLLLIQSLERHADIHLVAGPQGDDFAPMGIEKVVSVKGDEPTDQAAKGGVGLRMDGGKDAAEKVRQVGGPQRQPRDSPEAAAAAALEAPVEVWVGAGIGDSYLPVRRDDLGLEEICGGGAELFGVAAKPTG